MILVFRVGSARYKSLNVTVFPVFGTCHIIFFANITKNFAACSLVMLFFGWNANVLLYFVRPLVNIMLTALSNSVPVAAAGVTVSIIPVLVVVQAVVTVPHLLS